MTAKEFIRVNNDGDFRLSMSGLYLSELLVEFAKYHVEKIKELQTSKYYAGETGYIKKEEWEKILNNIQ